MLNYEIFKELNKFNKIKYYDEPHKYYIDEVQFTSCTTLLHQYEEEFDGEFWSNYKAIEKIVPADEFLLLKKDRLNIVENFTKNGGDVEKLLLEKNNILNEWQYKNHHATYEGSTLHDYIENYFLNKVFPYPEENAEKTLVWDDIKDTYKVMENQFHNFYNKVKDMLIPIRPELVVYDLDYMVSGMIDMLFYSTKYEMPVIFDWKTNTKLNMSNDFNRLKNPLGHLEACEFNIYSLQLHTYKHILEKNTNLKLYPDCYLVWFNENNEDFELIKTRDLSREVNYILNERKKLIKL